MKGWALCLLLFTLSVSVRAEPDPLVARLNADLMPLKDSPGSAERARIMAQLSRDLNQFYFAQNFAKARLTSRLTGVLIGRDLSDENLTPLTSAIAGALRGAIWCRIRGFNIRSSTEFRAATVQAYKALIALGVSTRDTQAVVALLFNAADWVAPPVIYR